jgi:rhamnosyltransferase
MPRPRASIVLPTLDGERHLARLLPMLQRQELAGGIEICAIDSGSTDRTRELLAAAGARVLEIPRAEFQHGAARNRCAQEARGEHLVFLSQDALPADERCLAELLAAFDDPRVAGATARILPHPGDDPLTRRTALEAPEASDRPAALGPEDLAAVRRGAGVCLNNVASAIRGAVFAELPFPEVAFGEDAAWTLLALARGHRVAFVPGSVVLHAHRYTPGAAFRRYRTDAAFRRRQFGERVRPSLVSVARGVAHEVGRDLAFLLRRPGRGRLLGLLRSPFLRAAQVLGQYAGSRA